MTALDTILSHISTARLAGAKTIQFTISASLARELDAEMKDKRGVASKLKEHNRAHPARKQRRKSRIKAARARQPDHPVPPVMHIDGCPIFVGEGDGISFSWKK